MRPVIHKNSYVFSTPPPPHRPTSEDRLSLNLSFSPEEYQKIQKLAESFDLTLSDFLRVSISAGLQNKEQQPEPVPLGVSVG